jgi:mRNA interferase RelE/StbE
MVMTGSAEPTDSSHLCGEPRYRLRVGEIRVFYDLAENEVQILAIVTKAEADEWLRREGVPE